MKRRCSRYGWAKGMLSGSPSAMYPRAWLKEGLTRKPLLLRSSMFTRKLMCSGRRWP